MIGCIIQARMGSTRLPGKVMMDLCGKPVLQRVIERVRKIQGLDKIIVATPVWLNEEPIWELCEELDVLYSTGPEDDVLNRYYKTASEHKLDTIVRITADCPLLDPELSSLVITYYQTGRYDYVSNCRPPSYPDGLDTEVFSFAALEQAWREAKLTYDRWHVTPYLWKEPSPVRKYTLECIPSLSTHRWTLDMPEDLKFIRRVYEELGENASTSEILRFDTPPSTDIYSRGVQ